MPSLFTEPQITKAATYSKATAGLMQKYNELAIKMDLAAEQLASPVETKGDKVWFKNTKGALLAAAQRLDSRGYEVDSTILNHLAALNEYLLAVNDEKNREKINEGLETKGVKGNLATSYKKLNDIINEENFGRRLLTIKKDIPAIAIKLISVEEVFVEVIKIANTKKGLFGVVKEVFERRKSTTVKELPEGGSYTNPDVGYASHDTQSFYGPSQGARKMAEKSAVQAGADPKHVAHGVASIAPMIAAGGVVVGRRNEEARKKEEQNNNKPKGDHRPKN